MSIEFSYPAKLHPIVSQPARYKIARGGRGSGKSWTIAKHLLIEAAFTKQRVLCTREYQSSVRDSVHKLLSDQIWSMGLKAILRHTTRWYLQPYWIRLFISRAQVIRFGNKKHGRRHPMLDRGGREGIQRLYRHSYPNNPQGRIGALFLIQPGRPGVGDEYEVSKSREIPARDDYRGDQLLGESILPGSFTERDGVLQTCRL